MSEAAARSAVPSARPWPESMSHGMTKMPRVPVIRTIEAGMTSSVLEETRAVLQRSGIVAMPTESFYAIGVLPLDATAVARLIEIKDRPAGQPIVIVIPDRDDVRTFGN